MDWHVRFEQQAGWTAPLRTYLFERAGLRNARRVLELGCGTGAVIGSLETGASVHGLDLLPERLLEAKRHAPQVRLTCGDGLKLPYPEATFEISFCHFLLLWVGKPVQALLEMKRVTRPGGSILALAEPDYSARVDEPAELARLGSLQTEALFEQGADPAMGKKLAGLFAQAGIRCVESGRLQRPSRQDPKEADQAMEWAVLAADLAGRLPEQELRRYERLDRQAWQTHKRVLYVPTYWVFGKRP